MSYAQVFFRTMISMSFLVLCAAGQAQPQLAAAPEWPGFEALNQFYVEAFINGENFGVTRVIGPDFPQLRVIEVDGRTYRVGAVELVGLLNEPVPQVYVVMGNPTKPAVRTVAKIRPLDEFEERALTALRSGDAVVFQDQGQDIRALGAIRADQQCLQCHDGAAGRLLGAFTYRLDSTEVEDMESGILTIRSVEIGGG